MSDDRLAKSHEVRRVLHEYLKQRQLDPNKALLLAGGAMYTHGMRDNITDIDFFHPDLNAPIKTQAGGYELDGGAGGDMPPAAWDSQSRYGLRVQSPQALLAFYQQLNRPKDQEKIQFLQKQLGTAKQADDVASRFTPDYTPEQLESMGVYDALYRGKGPRLASLGEWKPEWVNPADPKGWAQWYKRYSGGRRLGEEDERQIKRWLNFKSRHGGPFTKNPTPRRGWALRNWGIDPSKLVDKEQSLSVQEMLDEYQRKAMQKHVQAQINSSADLAAGNSERQNDSILKQADLLPEVQLQEHQQRVADKVTTDEPKLLVYHGLGSGKSLSALAAAEAAKKKYHEDYGIVVPASLRGNFQKEVKKFTTGSEPEILSYTGLALGKRFQQQPDTVIMDEAHRLRNPESGQSQAAKAIARRAERLMLLTGSPITNSPSDLASLLSMLNDKNISPEDFQKKFIGYRNVHPGVVNWFRGIKPGEQPYVKNEAGLRDLLRGKVDYQPSKTPDGVNVNEEVVRVPLSPEQQKIQKAIRTKIPPGFLWKLDREFPLSRDELAKLNSFLTGLRQVSLSTQPFRADKDPDKAFTQSAKLQAAMKNLQQVLDSDPRKKAIIYSNFIDSGLVPYSKALEKAQIPYGIFHGGIPTRQRTQALKDYNEGKLRALLLGPAAAEGISTKGTSLIQLLDPYWHESRSQQARGRGLRFDSHADLPEELKNVAVQRYISSSEDPSWLGKLMGYQKERTGDEILEHLSTEKERLNEEFRRILREEGGKAASVIDVSAGARQWFEKGAASASWMPSMPSSIPLPWTAATNAKKRKKKVQRRQQPVISNNGLAGAAAATAAAFPLISLHQDAFGTYPVLKERVGGLQPSDLYFADEMTSASDPIDPSKPLIQHGDVATYFGEPQGWFKHYKPNFSKLTQGGEWTSGTSTYHGMLLRPTTPRVPWRPDVQVLEGGDAFGDSKPDPKHPGFLTSPFFDYVRKRDTADAAKGRIPARDIGLYMMDSEDAAGNPNHRLDRNLRDVANNTSGGLFNRNFLALRNSFEGGDGDAANMPFYKRFKYYNDHLKRQHGLLQDYLKSVPPEEKEKVWGNLSERDSPILVTRSHHMANLLRNPATRDLAKDRVDQAYRTYAYRPYDLFSAMRAGAGRILFPKIAPQESQPGFKVTPEQIPSAPKLKCTEDYCVVPAAETLRSLGAPLGVTPRQSLPADLSAGTGFGPVGMIVPKPTRSAFRTLYGDSFFKPTLDRLKTVYGDDAPARLAAIRGGGDAAQAARTDFERAYAKHMAKTIAQSPEQAAEYKTDYQSKVLSWMQRSRNRRIATGLLAAAAMAGVGYGGTKLIQRLLAKKPVTEKKKKRRPQLTTEEPENLAKAAVAQYFTRAQKSA